LGWRSNKLVFELGERDEDAEDEFSGGRRRVDGGTLAGKAHARPRRRPL
jgi:hypothetical protein